MSLITNQRPQSYIPLFFLYFFAKNDANSFIKKGTLKWNSIKIFKGHNCKQIQIKLKFLSLIIIKIYSWVLCHYWHVQFQTPENWWQSSSYCFRELPLDLWEESTRAEFQPSTNGLIIKVNNDNLLNTQ